MTDLFPGRDSVQPVRAISLLQPYASAIIDGPKRIENRPRPLLGVIADGIWVAVHASKGWWDVDADIWQELWPESPGLSLVDGLYDLDPEAFTRGAILGLMHVVSCFRFTDAQCDLGVPADRLGPWAFGPVCYRIDAVRRLPAPIPCKGALGHWSIPFEVAIRLGEAR